MTAANPTIASLGLEPIYSARESALLLGRSSSWLDQRLRKGQFVLPDGTTVHPLRTSGRYRRFTIAAPRRRHKQLSTALVLDGGAEVGLPRAGYGLPHTDGRIIDSELSFLSHNQFVAG
jgi:hypothetical protein